MVDGDAKVSIPWVPFSWNDYDDPNAAMRFVKCAFGVDNADDQPISLLCICTGSRRRRTVSLIGQNKARCNGVVLPLFCGSDLQNNSCVRTCVRANGRMINTTVLHRSDHNLFPITF
jgi:hypothetical protein